MKRTCSGRTTATRGPRFLGRHPTPPPEDKVHLGPVPHQRPCATCRAKAGFGEVQAAVQGERQALGAARPRRCAGWWRRRGSQARAHPARGRAEGVGAEVLCELQPGRPAVGAALHVCAGAGGRWEDAARSTVPAVRGARRRRRRAGERGGGHATERLTQEREHAPSQPTWGGAYHARSARVKMKLGKERK